MQTLQTIFHSASGVLRMVSISDIADIIILAFVIYKIIGFIRRAQLSRVAVGLLGLVAVLWISDVCHLTVVNFLLRRIIELGLLALVILFQPELRRMLEKVGSGRVFRGLYRQSEPEGVENAILQTVEACVDMSATRTGALIVFERNNRLTDRINTGTVVDALPNAELLKNLFYNKAPLHDGAVIIRDGRIAAAGCMLPLSANPNLSKELGMRHRAGIGMSEQSDAVVVIVSEESGAISIAVNSMLKRHLNRESCEKILRAELLRGEETRRSVQDNLRDWILGRKGDSNGKGKNS